MHLMYLEFCWLRLHNFSLKQEHVDDVILYRPIKNVTQMFNVNAKPEVEKRPDVISMSW